MAKEGPGQWEAKAALLQRFEQSPQQLEELWTRIAPTLKVDLSLPCLFRLPSALRSPIKCALGR